MPDLTLRTPARVAPPVLAPLAGQYRTRNSVSVAAWFYGSSLAPLITLQLLPGVVVPGWELIKPLSLMIETEPGNHIVSETIFAMYGCGKGLSEAVHDYFVSLIEYYEMIEEQVNVEPANQVLLTHLARYLKRR